MRIPTFAGDFVVGGRRWRAKELEELRSQLAATLAAAGVSASSRVAIASADPSECVVAVAAVRDLGAVACVLSSRARGAARDAVEIAGRLRDCDPRVLLADEPHEAALREPALEIGCGVLLIGRGRLARPPDARTRLEHPRGSAVLCYTSGSESLAKGVLLSEEMIGYTLGDSARRWTRADRFCNLVALSHLGGLTHSVAALCAGATVVSADPAWLGVAYEALIENEVTALNLVPHHLSLLLARPEFEALTCLERAWLSAAPIRRGHVERAMEILPKLRFTHAYGLTEALRSTVLPQEDVPRLLPSIGRPVPGVEVQLRDESGRVIDTPEARGIAWIRGRNVMTGYWNRPEATAEALVDGWFCSNDLIHRHADGTLWIEGRRKEILNCGGEKMSPELIETCIAAGCPVDEVAVLGVPNPETGMDDVVAVVAFSGKTDVTLDAVRSVCSGSFHRAFLPSRLIRVDRLARRPEGKLDRRRLREELKLSA